MVTLESQMDSMTGVRDAPKPRTMEGAMQALVVQGPDQQPQLVDVPVPEATAGQVPVKVLAAGLNAIDSAIAAGLLRGMMDHDDPVVLGATPPAWSTRSARA
jgi:hypothetical protein